MRIRGNDPWLEELQPSSREPDPSSQWGLIATNLSLESSVQKIGARNLARKETVELREMLRATENPEDICTIILALKLKGTQDPQAVEALIELTDYPDRVIKAAAIKVLGDIKARSALNKLQSMLPDKDSLIRREATFAIRRITTST